jgi:sec-independent protein translocase protein TatC
MRSSWLDYIIELRKRLLHCVILLLSVFFILMFFANKIYTYLSLPLLKNLPKDHGLIATNVTSAFFVPLELVFFISLFIGIPFFLYQLWVFIAPALYKDEKRMLWPLLLVSSALFYCGIAFAYWILLPILFKFLVQSAPIGVSVSPDISQYLDFTLKLFFIFGGTFEIPVIIILLVWSGIVRREQLKKIRPYVIVAAFVIAMLIGPPDVLSQILLAIPFCLLYEIGIIFSHFITKKSS